MKNEVNRTLMVKKTNYMNFAKRVVMALAVVLMAANVWSATWNLTTNEFESENTTLVVWSSSDATMTLAKGTCQTNANNYLGGKSTYNHTRVYAGQTLTISPASGKTITSIAITATSSTNNITTTWNNGSASASNDVVTITPEDGTNDVYCTCNSAKLKAVTVTVSSGCTGDELEMSAVTATPGDEQVTLSWDAVTGATKYQVKWDGGSWTDVNTNSYTKTGLTNGTEYTYQVKAIGNGTTTCDSDPTDAATVKPGLCYKVSFSTGEDNPEVASKTESEYGDGITLPAGPTPNASGDGWVFAGWGTAEVSNVTVAPRLYMPNDYYYPEGNETLYAVYRKLTSGTSTATFTSTNLDNLTQLSEDTSKPAWWIHTATGVEFYINSWGIYDSNGDKFNIYSSWALIDAHTKIQQVEFSIYNSKTISSVELSDAEEEAGGTAELSGSSKQTVTCSGDVTQLYLYKSSGDAYFTTFTVTYYNAKYHSNPVPCAVNPTVGNIMNAVSAISSTGATFSTSAGVSAGTGCDLTAVGFVYGTATAPTLDNNVASIDNYTSGVLNKSITGLTPNTKYYVRAYATNSHGTTYSDEKEFTTLQRYNITYNNNGGSGSMDGSTKDHGADFTLPANAGTMTKTGYHIANWRLGSASGTSYSLGDTYDGNAAAEFYAGWEPNTFSVAFNKNGGQGDAMTNQAFTYDAAQNLSANTYTPAAGSHKYFAGWATSSSRANAGTVDYADKASVSNLTPTNNGTYTLYAVWKDHTYTNYRTSCCTELGTVGGAVEFTDPTTAVVTWNDMSNVAASDPYAVTYRTGSDDFGSTNVGEITTNNITGKKECTITGLSCNTVYDFQIEVTAATGYCDKEQVIEGQNSGKYAITSADGGIPTGGTFVTLESACSGDNVDLLAEATTGYDFAGWTITKASSGTVSPAADEESTSFTMPAENVTVSAAFNAISYSISYENMEGATNHANNPTSYTVEDAISLGNPTKSGFNFGGWFVNEDLAAGHEAGSPAIAAGSTGNKTFYAKWIADDKWSVAITAPSHGTITVSWNGGANSFDEGSQNINKNTVVTITATPSAGYELTSLKIGDEDFVSGNTHALASSIVISATFSIINYDITYHLYGGTNSQGNPATFTINDDDIIFDEPTKTGYDFDDWYSNENFEGEAVNGVAHGTHENVDVWAKWTPNEYKVTIDKNYGTATSVDVTATFDAEMPSIIGKSIGREGYSFAGIFANQDGTGTKYYNADKSSAHVWDQAEDATIYAHWSPKNYTITLNNEGADEGKGGTASIAVTFDSNENLSGTPAITRPEKAGYKFCGYYTLANGDGSQIIDENGDVKASVSGYTSDTKQWRKAGSDVVTLYAYWRPIYTVTWSVNGTETTEPVIKDEKVAALPTAPTSSDCDDAKKFVGWRAEAIEGVSATAPSGIFTTVAASPEITGNVTFYAVFADENGGDFTRVTNTNQLEAGKKVLLGYEAVANSGEIVPIQSASLNGTLLYTGATAGSAGTSTLTISSMSAGDEASFAFTLHEGHNSGYWAFEMSGDNAGNYLSHRGATDGKNSITSAESITDDGMTDFSIEIGTNDVTTIINKWGDQNTSKDGSNYNNYKILSYNVPSSGNPRAAIYKAVQTGQFVMYICNPLVYSNYVTTCASCTDVPTFNATPTISEIGCTSATVTATNGLESLGEGDGCNIREYGFVWGTTETPTVDSNNGKHSVSENIAEDVAWDYEITGLTKGTQYYVRAYAENKSGVAYSDAASFWTKNVSNIAVTTAPTKTKYIVGEAFDATGMVVTATLAGGATEDVTADVTYSTSALTVGVDQNFTISYTLCETEKTANQTINVYTLSVNEGTNADKGVASYTTGATFSVGSLAEYTTFNFDVTNGFVTPNGDGTTYTVTPNGNGNVTVTVNYVTAVPVAVKFYVNGNELTGLAKNPYQSEEFDMPNASAVASAMTAASISVGDVNFVGWSTTPFGYQTSEPTLVGASASVMEATNYYAVFTNLESVQIVPNDFNGTKAINEGEKTIDGVKYNIHEMCKQNGIQFSSGGYLYTIDAIRDIKKVEITGIDLPVYVCSNASGSVDGSAITSVGTAPYVYTFPANKQYLKITDRNGTSKVSLIKIYYAPEDVYYATEFKTLTFNKANGAVDKTEKVATGKTRTLSADDAPAAVAGYTFMEKWSDGANDYVAGDGVTVNEDMTLNPYSGLITDTDVDINALPATVTEIVVTDGKTLTANADKTLDNLTIEAGGKVSGSNNLTVINNLLIKTSLGTISGDETNTNGKSGEITNGNKIVANGDVFIEIELTQEDKASTGWYAFSVPFPVDAINGVYYNDTKLTNEVGYAIMSYHGDVRAQGHYAWKKYRGIMQPGTLYIITVGKTYYKTLRFKKVAGADLIASNEIAVKKYPLNGGTTGDNGWNGIGNPNLQVSRYTGSYLIQFLDHQANSFKVRNASAVNLMVGSAFMMQSTATENITITAGNDGSIALAPAREMNAEENTLYEVKLRNNTTNIVEDNLFFMAREDATNSYETGYDLVKLSMGEAKCAQMYVPAYGTKLCAADFPLVNGQAEYPLTITAPADGSYRIETPTESEDATLYLTKDGRAIWNLSMSACEVELSKGTTENYGLLLVRKAPGVATGNLTPTLSQGEGAKILIDEHVYILRGGQMYDVTGKAVK